MKIKIISIALALALSACSDTTTNGSTTYSANTAEALSIITSIDSGFYELLNDPNISKSLGSDNVAKIKAELTKISAMQAQLSAADPGTISVTKQKSILLTAESAANAALQIAKDVNATGLIPAPASTIIAALSALVPAIETFVGAVSVSEQSTMSVEEAKKIIAQHG